MRKPRVYSEKRYIVHFYSDGHCYNSKFDCPKSYVDMCRYNAKLTGEKIKVELDRVIKYEY